MQGAAFIFFRFDELFILLNVCTYSLSLAGYDLFNFQEFYINVVYLFICSLAGCYILLLQESYVHLNSVLVHLSNWIFWSKIL